jgi:hypothetical protein
MAGAEKICELTGEFPGGEMYRFKRHQLQIMPNCRTLFRGDGDTIYVQKDGLYWEYKWGGWSEYNIDEMNHYDSPFKDEAEFVGYKRVVENLRLVKCYQYAYVTNNPDLKGNVNGIYINYTYDVSSVKRRMKRLLRCRNLNIVFVDNLSEFVKQLRA